MTGPDLRDVLRGVSDGLDLSRTPKPVLMDTVARLQLEVVAMKARMLDHQTIGGPTSPVRHKPVVFMSTALQLLSHLEGDALNVTLLVPEARRATRT